MEGKKMTTPKTADVLLSKLYAGDYETERSAIKRRRQIIAEDFSEKEKAKAAKDFELHVMLVMKQEGVPAPKARMVAYFEGPLGLPDRLGS